VSLRWWIRTWNFCC